MTSIEWTDETWNPVVGCSRVSAGCEHCYAEGVAHRGMSPHHRGLTVLGAHGPRWNGVVRFVPEALAKPLSWKKPRRVFVNSMSDLFHEALPFEQIAAVFGVMAACPQHAFQVLTKRSVRAAAFFKWASMFHSIPGALNPFSRPPGQPMPAWDPHVVVTECARSIGADMVKIAKGPWPLPNVWLGVSVEDQATADERIPALLELPAAVRFVSYEPALGPVTFRGASWLESHCPMHDTASGFCSSDCPDRVRGLDWIIVGGESGPGARPFDVTWARSVIAQGRAGHVPVFLKQLGAEPFMGSNALAARLDIDPLDFADALADKGLDREHVPLSLRDRKGGNPDEWPTDLRVRQFPEVRS